MKKTLVVALAVQSAVSFGATHGFDDNPSTPFNATNNARTEMTVKWLAVADVQSACEQASKQVGNKGFGFAVNACSFWQKNKCVIITKDRPTMGTLGHEMRHCFQGSWH